MMGTVHPSKRDGGGFPSSLSNLMCYFCCTLTSLFWSSGRISSSTLFFSLPSQILFSSFSYFFSQLPRLAPCTSCHFITFLFLCIFLSFPSLIPFSLSFSIIVFFRLLPLAMLHIYFPLYLKPSVPHSLRPRTPCNSLRIKTLYSQPHIQYSNRHGRWQNHQQTSTHIINYLSPTTCT